MTLWVPGVRLGPYELLAPIGAGGMGEVWKATDTRLHRVVAVKRFQGQHGERFKVEARAIAAFNHPHICQIHDVGSDYLVLEYVEGVPLPCPLETPEALRLAIEIAGAVEAAHAKGIIHRDLKPANILMTREGSVKLLDFGIAKFIADAGDETVTLEGSVFGTAPYMSPEQAEGKPLDERSDVFSFGAVLYEMLSGKRAFMGRTAAEVLTAILHHEPSPLQTLPALADIVRRCLSKPRTERFQSMSEVRKALEAASGKPAEPNPSIAVLPFATMSANKDDEYFSDGLAEEIISALAGIQGLNVTSRTSSFSFRGKDVDIRKIAETLNVRTILEGSVRRMGNRIRVTAQLIDAANGYHLWSERYDRELADVFSIQDDIAQAIAMALKVRLSSDAVPARRHTPGIPAYEAFLKAKHFLRKGTPASVARAQAFLEQAIALDANFALAYAELASCFRVVASLVNAPSSEALLQARAAAARSVDIDPTLPQARALLAQLMLFLDYDWPAAARHFELAIAHQPIPSEVSHLYGFFFLLPLGRINDAILEMERSLKDDPLNLECLAQYASLLWAVGRNEEALTCFNQALELDENSWLALFLLALWNSSVGSLEAGMGLAERAHALMPGNLNSVGLLAGYYSRTGEHEKANQLLEALGDGTTFGAPLGWNVYHSVRLDYDKSADWVEKAIEQHDPNALPAACGCYRREYIKNGRWPKMARLLRLPETATVAIG